MQEAGLLAYIVVVPSSHGAWHATVTLLMNNLLDAYSSGNCPRFSRGSLLIPGFMPGTNCGASIVSALVETVCL